MYVYIKFEGLVKVVSNVTIDDDCGPVVEGKLIAESPRRTDSVSGEGGAGASRNSVDAISWFKSLPMEAVYLDCSAREAKWCPRSVTIHQSQSDTQEHLLTPKVSVRLRRNPKKKVYIDETAYLIEDKRPFMPESARPLFSDHPGVADFNPIIDEMFERAEQLIRNWERLCESEQLYTEIAQILHCYVFPAVSFLEEDVAVLKECLRLVSVKLDRVEKEIMDTEKNVEITEKYLNKQKEVILEIEGMTTQTYLQACDKQFIESFYMHVTKDIQKRNARLDNIQRKMNELRKTGEEAEKVDKLKKDRDDTHEVVQNLIVVREAIRNHLYRPFIPKKKKRGRRMKLCKKDTNLHAVFQQVHQQLVEHKDHLRKLCYRKLYTSSVREAVESTVKMVSTESPRGQGDFSEFSIYVGNGEARKEQWQSMRAKVDEWMSEGDCALFRSHREGCQLVRDLADSILSDGQMASMGLEGSPGADRAVQGDFEMIALSSLEGSAASGCGGGQAGRNDAENDDLSYRRAPMVKVMRDQVLVQTWQMAEDIVNHMDYQVAPGSRHINRAWVCYCPHFWGLAGEAVERVYTHFHTPQARKVHRLVSSVALSDIMDSNFFRDFFTKRLSRGSSTNSEGEEGPAGVGLKHVDSVSAVSLDLMRCSVSDLYAWVNRDGARMNYEMLEMEALSRSLDLLSMRSRNSMDGDDRLSTASVGNIMVGGNALVAGDDAGAERGATPGLGRSDSSASDSGASVHSEDLFDSDSLGRQDRGRTDTETARSSQTVASVLSLFEAIVVPYHQKVRAVLEAGDVMEKMRAVWQSVDFLCQKGGEICQARGMDTLLPLSIFATTSFTEDLFVRYYIQLLILLDLKPSFAFHSMYDFSLTNAISSYMYLFEAKFPPTPPASDESDT